MTDTAAPSTRGRTTHRGRIDKRRAILDAAFVVFAQAGFEGACVRKIAAEAGVAKPTVYNHLGDKETLFRHSITAVAERELAEHLEAVESLVTAGGDVREALTDLALRLARNFGSDRASSLRRLVVAEVSRFPELLDAVWGPRTNRVEEALADRLARLALAGCLNMREPVEAAEQFIALLSGPIESRSRFGTRRLADQELQGIAVAAVRTFLRAFGAPATEGERSAPEAPRGEIT
ncbi:TetR/AcrR family transcriptional regulator [Saccharothrix obliqua]|uniref:TetR/AcrR family transcriptional regulator n=1 Tax=Saccharothrix obliqua TaxID=2861747 RepID=UPI001C5DE03D|nr:TetR/AcrR family transcriptional regulator [Saccharothrix obliqua]MBW4722357.1 TetR/AcrR family transcriptional regulator [Saccharothrix obliqua]